MTTAYLNGQMCPLEDARVSPMDRGFLFGDGIYEVIPSYGGQLVGLQRHLERLDNGLSAIHLANPHTASEWQGLFTALIEANGAGNLGVYLQVTRGVSMTRAHRFPENTPATVFAYTFEIPEPSDGDPSNATTYRVVTVNDRRWRRCDIKSVALLGNVLHMMEGVHAGADEVLLFNDEEELTEAAACNVFAVQNGEVVTPPLDSQKLPGVTRNMLVDILRAEGWPVLEQPLRRDAILTSDEVWLTSSIKEVAPVVAVDDHPIGGGIPGPLWSRAQATFAKHRFSA